VSQWGQSCCTFSSWSVLFPRSWCTAGCMANDMGLGKMLQGTFLLRTLRKSIVPLSKGRSTTTAGCILADDMGLGKTLQGISLLWTLLQSGHASLGGAPIAKRVVIVCPTSLVGNWDSECQKWLKVRL